MNDKSDLSNFFLSQCPLSFANRLPGLESTQQLTHVTTRLILIGQKIMPTKNGLATSGKTR